MCDPVSLGVGTALTGAASTIGGAQSQQQQANAQYAASKNQRQHIINQQRSQLTLDTARYNQKKADRKANDIEAGRAANDAYLGNQNVYNDKIKAFMSSKQTRMIKALETAGTIGAKGTSGGSKSMMQTANKAALGRDTAMGLANLRSAATQMTMDNRAVQGQLQGEYMNNFSQIGALPTAAFTPPEVAKPAGPNPLSIAAGLGSAVLGGVGAFQSASALPNGQTQTDLGGGGGTFAPFTSPWMSTQSLTGINYGD